MTSILDLINENSDDSTKIDYAPYIQFVGVKDSKKPGDYGLFISDENAERVGFEVSANSKMWKKRTHQIAAGKTLEGWICQEPRIIILRSSPLSMFSKENGRFISEFNSDIYNKSTRHLYTLKTKYAVILVDENKNALHKGSLIYNPKGVSGSTFGLMYKEFKQEYQKVIKQTRQDPFWVNVVYCPKAGWKVTEANHIVGCYTGYKVPAIDTPEEQADLINDYILKTDSVFKQITEEYQIYKAGLTYKPYENEETYPSENYTPVEVPVNKPVDFSKMLQTMMDESLGVLEDAKASITKDEPLQNLAAQSARDRANGEDDIPF